MMLLERLMCFQMMKLYKARIVFAASLCLQMLCAMNGTADEVNSITKLIDALGGQDAVARFMAEEKLVDMGDAAVICLEPLATSTDSSPARQYAINILARIGTGKATKLLLRILEQEPDVHIRALICRHLGKAGVKEAVPIIGKWLYTIQGKSFDYGREPQATNIWYSWIIHVHALGEVGSEDGIPILEKMLATEHGGRAGKEFAKAYQEALDELKQEAAFWNAIRDVPELEDYVRLLFQFFRKDTLALIRLHRYRVIRLELEGRWVLENMRNHPDEKLRQATALMLKDYEKLKSDKDQHLKDERSRAK